MHLGGYQELDTPLFLSETILNILMIECFEVSSGQRGYTIGALNRNDGKEKTIQCDHSDVTFEPLTPFVSLALLPSNIRDPSSLSSFLFRMLALLLVYPLP
ncbi:hypothetical protein SDC9_113520 [bioreactor metagenome]|uniref:Uncharacterized protein n=1 Tax=bioreactor metagenome TaxID=1076179 RepID=A0A645BMA4_9ZZZZ